MNIETIAVHAAGGADSVTGALAPPIHLSTTFEHGPACELPHGFLYIREGNPTQARLENALAQLEGGAGALVFSSGMAAGAALLQTLEPESHVIFPSDIYVDFRTVAREFFPKWRIEYSIVDMTQTSVVRDAIRPNTKLLWVETPSNPLMQVVDVAAIAQVARQAGARTVVDNTFATPVLQRPLEFGADVSLYSSTKYFGGHSDVQGGALVFRAKDGYMEAVEHTRKLLGAVASPFNSWLILRGLRSLVCRIERHSANAMAVARALANSKDLNAVNYPGLESHPGYAVAKKQMRLFGGMLSIQVKGGRERALAVASRVKLFVNATSLGGVESLLEHRASSEGPSSTTPPDLLRLSVGLEHPDDLIADLMQAIG
jgi:cystathionine gamma-synthase